MKMPFQSATDADGNADEKSSCLVSSNYSDNILLATEAKFWNRRYATQDFIWTVDANQYLIAEAAELLPGIALDLAAGEGRNAVWLAKLGWKVRAFDFSEPALEKGKRLAALREVTSQVHFRNADLRDFELGVHLYDLVTLIYLQIPLAQLVPIIKRAAKAVAPGGTFLLIAHDSTNLEHGYGGSRHPAMLYTAEQVVEALDGELTIEKASCVKRAVDTPEGTQTALDCLVRGKRP